MVAACAIQLMDDLASCISKQIKLTTYCYKQYLDVVEMAFGNGVDYATFVKYYGELSYYVGAEKRHIVGNSNEETISTSFIERQALTIHTSNKPFTRKMNA